MSIPVFPIRRLAARCMAGQGGWRKLMLDQKGAAAVEYGFLVALIVIAVMFAIAELGQANTRVWKTVTTKMISA